MDFSLNDDQLALQAVRRLVDTSTDPADLATLGVHGITMPEAFGGSGQTAIERMLVATELGRGLQAGAWQVSAVQAGSLLQGCLAEPSAAAVVGELLTQLGNASQVATLARAQAGAQCDGVHLSAQCRHVLLPPACDWLLVFVPEPARFVLIDAHATGIVKKTFTVLDGSQGAHIRFEKAAIHAVLAQGDTAVLLDEQVRCHADASYCAEALGAMQKMLELSTEHLKTRQQFGSPLAKFQALQHQMADQLVRYELFASLVALAAMGVADTEPTQRSARHYSSAAMAYLAQHCKPFCEAIIQLHGAMGVTDESMIGKLAKRVLFLGHWHGNSMQLRQRYSESSL
jgi:alkylation response protein AidB-like acyl-CoA dehydrogenase